MFSVHVTWRQLPRYGPSSPKRLEQQGRQFCEPACKKTWGKVKCISLLSIRQPLPNQTCLSTARPHYQEHLQQHHNSFHQKRPCQLWPVLPLLLGSVDTEDWIGPGGSNKLLRAPPRNVPISVDNNAKNQTIQLLTSLAAKSLSISNQGSTSSHICGSSPSNSTDVSRSSPSLPLTEAW